MGTKWTGDVKLRYERTRETDNKPVDMDATGSTVASSNDGSSESAVVSPSEVADSKARSQLRRKTNNLSPHVDSLTGANHGVKSNVLQT